MAQQKKLGLMVDVETTGLGPATDEIIELAVKLFSFQQDTGEIIEIIEQDSFLREPVSSSAKRNYANAYRVHGIPYELVEGESFLDDKVTGYFGKADAVFAHNASFDRSFLYHMYPEVNNAKWYCTMRNVPWKNYGFANGKLLTLLQSHKITNHQSHRAMDDITYLMELLKKTNPKGEPYLKEVLTYGHMRRYQPAVKRESWAKRKASNFEM
ncbi:DNA polymerase III subunit epsilon [Peribacillus cavernae]|uniref:DNA polymerase III subunit epsilon n=1 Tax=Peribacillus cavernae TaxID=1674310 RepID=A0A3S0U0E8_9BACI|nr:exonuclease domain-containing protein [Peribacillus cavernae]MDQ0219171.1 DNA polymerase-3 subunit epsilon [Peribacillus cavernae]RUQ28603.1 DNA polymerase III subunit epsilon [Peribacillus cavernae]